MLNSFKEVLEKEREAENIVNIARKKAKQIESDAQEKAETVYNQTYQETIDNAKRSAIETKERAKKEAKAQAQVYVQRAKILKKKLTTIGTQNFDDAVNCILQEILS